MMKINSTFFTALEQHMVIAEVIDIDHHRSFSALGAVDTCYVIQVSSNNHASASSTSTSAVKKKGAVSRAAGFQTYRIGKHFKDFRKLMVDLNQAVYTAKQQTHRIQREKNGNRWRQNYHYQQQGDDHPESTKELISLVESLSPLIEKEPLSSYFGKMSFSNVVELTNARRKIINKTLKILLENYPSNNDEEQDKMVTTHSSPSLSPSSSSSNVTMDRQQEECASKLYESIITDFFFTDCIIFDEHNSKIFGVSVPLNSSPGPIAPAAERVDTSNKNDSDVATPQHKTVVEQASPVNSTLPSSTTTTSSSPSPKRRNERYPDDPTDLLVPPSPPILPLTSKYRLSKADRNKLEERLRQSGNILTIHDEDYYSHNIMGENGNQWRINLFGTSILVFDKDCEWRVCVLFCIVVLMFVALKDIEITIHADIGVVVLLAVYTLGMRLSEASATVTVSDLSGGVCTSGGASGIIKNKGGVGGGELDANTSTTLLRRSLLGGDVAPSRERTESNISIKQLVVGDDDDSQQHTIVTQSGLLQTFPNGAKLGSVMNAVSEPAPDCFHVRGGNYLVDRKKVASGPFLFPTRGVDLFLSDCCPEHIARYNSAMGGKLREKPTFLVNFRLPWGVLVLYHEIPSKYLPFLNHRYNNPADPSTPPSTEGFSNEDRCVARFLLGSEEHKQKTLKIVPSLVKGPWVVKKVVDGKPAIVGTKMPINYFYAPADRRTGQSEYLEADLDIVGSSVARSILAVAQRYTKTLTLDLGFVIQGNSADELPEQMLIATRIHGVDPVEAPALPDEMVD